MLSRKLRLANILPLVKGKRVLVRANFDVPIPNSVPSPDNILQAVTKIVPTVSALLSAGARRVVLASHMGTGAGSGSAPTFVPFLVPLQKALGRQIVFLPRIGAEREGKREGEVALVENLHFWKEEAVAASKGGRRVVANHRDVRRFAKSLEGLADIYVNEAFGVANCPYTSISGLNIPVRAAGLNFAKELDGLAHILERPHRPLVLIIGGNKLDMKLRIMDRLVDLADEILLGGIVAQNFLKSCHGTHLNAFHAASYSQRSSDIERICKKAAENGTRLHLHGFDCYGGVHKPWRAMDIGTVIDRAQTVLWMGAPGMADAQPFSVAGGSLVMLELIERATGRGANSVVIESEIAEFVKRMPGAESRLTHVSDEPDAATELIMGRELPGITSLTET